MVNYKVRFSGSCTIAPIEFDWNELSDQHVEKRIDRKLPYYYPAFYKAEVFDETDRCIAEYTCQITVRKV